MEDLVKSIRAKWDIPLGNTSEGIITLKEGVIVKIRITPEIQTLIDQKAIEIVEKSKK